MRYNLQDVKYGTWAYIEIKIINYLDKKLIKIN